LDQELSRALNRRFEELFDLAVDKAMLLLGESGKQAIYYHLEEILGLEEHKQLLQEAVLKPLTFLALTFSFFSHQHLG
jgi:hypothetical protein